MTTKSAPNPARPVAWLILAIGIIGGAIALLMTFSGSETILGFDLVQLLVLAVAFIIVGLILLYMLKPIEVEVPAPAPVVESNTEALDDIDARIKVLEAHRDNPAEKVDIETLDAMAARIKTLEARQEEVVASTKPAEVTKVVEAVVEAAPVEPDNLKVIEGIGPKIAMALVEADINSYDKLAAADIEQLRAAVQAAGIGFAPSLSTWAKQAKLIVAGDMAGFKAYIDALDGGRE